MLLEQYRGAMHNKLEETGVPLGEFPFPVPEGPHESRYLTWLRNHSNYMGVRGLLDYVRSVAVLLRGIVVNSLVILPFLLLIAIWLAYTHHWMRENPFLITKVALVATAAWIVLFVTLGPVFKIKQYRRSVAYGSESSIGMRDIYERSFSLLLITILAIAVFEALPSVVEWLRDLRLEGKLGWQGGVAAVGTIMAVLSRANTLLSGLAGMKKKLAMALIGVLGILAPLLVVLFVADFLLYGPIPASALILFSPVVLLVILFVVTNIGAFFVFYRRLMWWLPKVFTFKDYLKLQMRLIVAYAVLLIAIGLSLELIAPNPPSEYIQLEQFETLAKSLENVSKKDLDPGITVLVDDFVSMNDQYQKLKEELEYQDRNGFGSGELRHKIEATLKKFVGKFQENSLDNTDLDNYEELNRISKYFATETKFARLGDKLSSQSEGSLIPLRREISRLAVGQLFDIIKKRIGNDDDNGKVTKLLVNQLLTEKLLQCELLAFECSFDNVAEQVNEALRNSSASEIAVLISPKKLANAVKSKYEGVSRLPDSVDPGNRDEIARLLPKDELISLVALARTPAQWKSLAQDAQSDLGELIKLRNNIATAYADLFEQLKNARPPASEDVLNEYSYAENESLDKIVDSPGRQILNDAYGYLFDPDALRYPDGAVQVDGARELARFAAAAFFDSTFDGPGHQAVTQLIFGNLGLLQKEYLATETTEMFNLGFPPKALFVFLLAVSIFFVCWASVDVNLTSIHGLYRDRLASAFLVGVDTKGDVDIEEDIDLHETSCYEAGSTAPYHLINVALNLQGSKDIGLRDRKSDFFIFSKRFIGGPRTGYCRSETMEQVFPQMDLATAMAVSAAAAAPNMGRETSPLLVAFLTLLNVRLGFWMPNPGRLEECLKKSFWQRWQYAVVKRWQTGSWRPEPLGFRFEEVFRAELLEIQKRWDQAYAGETQCRGLFCDEKTHAPILAPTIKHGLVGLAFSGGGIRSAAINLGITQTLHKFGVFKHVDYMSTVSGGGYLGSSLSTLMRSRQRLVSEVDGLATVNDISEIAGNVTIKRDGPPEGTIEVVITPKQSGEKPRVHRFSKDTELAVAEGDEVKIGQLLLKHRQVVVKPKRPSEKVRTYRYSPDAYLNVRDGEKVNSETRLLKPLATATQSAIAGTVQHIEINSTDGGQIVTVKAGRQHGMMMRLTNAARRMLGASAKEQANEADGVARDHRFTRFDTLVVKEGDYVQAGQQLVKRHNSLGDRHKWRVRTLALMREILSRLDERHRWVNLSDGGHIENLATFELLRRRCKYIIIGDGEADPKLQFGGLATLMRCAYIDLGIRIEINLDELRLRKVNDEEDEPAVSGTHYAVGTITYPKKDSEEHHEIGYLLYLKSSFTGHEYEGIREYRHRNPDFPHQSTSDQFFDEGQFEAYRALGQRIAKSALTYADGKPCGPSLKNFEDLIMNKLPKGSVAI